MGLKGKRADVLERIEKELGNQFTDADYALHESGAVVWETRVSYERAAMVREGILKSSAVYGVWELSETWLAKTLSQAAQEHPELLRKFMDKL